MKVRVTDKTLGATHSSRYLAPWDRIKWRLTESLQQHQYSDSRKIFQAQPVEVNRREQTAAAASYRKHSQLLRAVLQPWDTQTHDQGVEEGSQVGKISHWIIRHVYIWPDLVCALWIMPVEWQARLTFGGSTRFCWSESSSLWDFNPNEQMWSKTHRIDWWGSNWHVVGGEWRRQSASYFQPWISVRSQDGSFLRTTATAATHF